MKLCRGPWRMQMLSRKRVPYFDPCKDRYCEWCGAKRVGDKLERWVPVLEEAGVVYRAKELLDGSTWVERRAAGEDEDHSLKSLQILATRIGDSLRDRAQFVTGTNYLWTRTYDLDGRAWVHYITDRDLTSPRAKKLNDWKVMDGEAAVRWLEDEMVVPGRLIKADGGGAWRGTGDQLAGRPPSNRDRETQHVPSTTDGVRSSLSLSGWGTSGRADLGVAYRDDPWAAMELARMYVEERGGEVKVAGYIEALEGTSTRLVDEGLEWAERWLNEESG